MASKKYIFLVAVLVMLQIAGNAQTKTDWGWDWKDSSKVPTKSIPQYNEFLNNQFPYPPKPKNAWELGLTAGISYVIGDRPLLTKNSSGHSYTGGYVVGLSLRKSLGHIISLRGALSYSQTSIPQYSGSVYVTSGSNNTLTASMDALVSLNTISYYRGNPKTNWYVLGGYSIIATQTKARQPNGSLLLINYPQAKTFGKVQDLILMHGVDVGAGVAFKVSPRFNIGLEQKFTVPLLGNDYLDGYKSATGGTDFLSYSSIRFNFNLGN